MTQASPKNAALFDSQIIVPIDAASAADDVIEQDLLQEQ